MSSGGCQCGAVRYAFDGEAKHPHLCHCRMCQKAAGNYFMPLANVDRDDFRVTRGEIAYFQSSDPVRRGFCRNCGTPLTFETMGAPHLNVVLGSLDDPAAVPPLEQHGLESRMPFHGALRDLPGETTEANEDQDGVRLADIAASNRQHPDRDTDDWPR